MKDSRPLAPLLTLNVGSTSVRLDLFERMPLRRLASQRLGHADPSAAVQTLRRFAAPAPPAVVAHRVVHGGERLRAPCWVDGAVEAELARLGTLAPLHNPPALAWLRGARAAFPHAAHAAAFDTAFYAALPAVASAYALPAEIMRRHGIRRYGFHGLAHQALLRQWGGHRPAGRVISMQLGGGCSMTASRDGRPLDTSMGFSPLEGLVMGSRCGDLDPSVLIHLQRAGLDAATLEQMLNRESGLLGLSGLSADMEQLLASNAPAAVHAVDVFCHRARRYLGAFLGVLGGADAVLLSGGMAEHSAVLRARVLEGFEWAGIRVDAQRNAHPQPQRISAADSAVEVRVIAVDEAWLLAEACDELGPPPVEATVGVEP